MELHHVEIVGLHALQALLDARRDIFPGEHVRAALTAGCRRRPDQAATFAGEEILVAAMADVAADALLAQSIVDRGVDVVDAGVEHCVEDGFRLALADVAAAGCAAQLHRPIAEHRHVESGAAQLPPRQIGHRKPPSGISAGTALSVSGIR